MWRKGEISVLAVGCAVLVGAGGKTSYVGSRKTGGCDGRPDELEITGTVGVDWFGEQL